MSRIDELSQIVSRAYKILLDKTNFTDIIRHISKSDKSFSVPSESEFQNIYAVYSDKDIMKAIMKAISATMNLFHKISVGTADKWDYKYPVISDKYATEWFNNIYWRIKNG